MARIVSLGSGLQNIFLIDHDDLTSMVFHGEPILNRIHTGTNIEIDNIAFEVGGSGVNSAIAFSRFGHEAILMGNIAKDAAGTAIVKKLEHEGVDTSYLNFLSRKSTGASVILLNSNSGERTTLTCNGASDQFGNLDSGDLGSIQPEWLYITNLYGDFEVFTKFATKARQLGAKIVFNPGRIELSNGAEMTKALKLTDILIVNKKEASRMVPGKTLSELLYHLQGYVPATIVTDGPMGGVATDGKETYRFGIYEDIKIVDATGAGDAFGAGFVAHFAEKHNFKDALIFASANATSVIGKVGGNVGILSNNNHLHPMPIQKI